MKIRTLMAALLAAFGPSPVVRRAKTRDVAFGYRMGAGFPGDVNRMHPASILAALANATNPPAVYGGPVLVGADGASVRGIIAADGNTSGAIYGVLSRPYPAQQTSGSPTVAIGSATPPTSGVIDVLRSGFIMVKLPAGATVVKGGAVYVWAVAPSGAHITGQFEAVAAGASTYTITNARFTGPADANGNAEVEVWAA